MVKRMTRVMVPMAIVLAIALAAPPVVGAQAILGNPEIAALSAGKNEVFVQVASTPVEIHGRFIAFDATAFTMEVDGRSFSFPSNEVLRIDTTGAINRSKMRRGAVIGGLVTGVWCAVVCGQGVDSAAQVPLVVLVNGATGAAVGALIGLRRDGRKTIYTSAGTGTAVSRRPSDLPCPATPLVLEAELSPIDLRKLTKTWTPVPQSHGFGASRCDGVTIQGRYDAKTGVWQPGVEIAAGPVEGFWDEHSINVRVRVTVRNPNGGSGTQAHVNVALMQDGRSQVTAIASIDARADEESRGDAYLRVPRALLSGSATGLSLQLTLTTSHKR